jgi:hypothetical protein
MKHLMNISFSSSSLTDFVNNKVTSASIVVQEEGITVHLEYSTKPYRSKVVFAGTIGSIQHSDDHLLAWLLENGADMNPINAYLQEHMLTICTADSGKCKLTAMTGDGESFIYNNLDEYDARTLATFMHQRGWFINGVKKHINDCKIDIETPELDFLLESMIDFKPIDKEGLSAHRGNES